MSRLDNFKTTIIRHNRFSHGSKHESHGIDLDDGSSNYHIYNNLCLGTCFKLREGFFRLVENNICVGPTPVGLHAWYKDGDAVIRRNIIVNTKGTHIYDFLSCNYALGAHFDYNLFFNNKGEQKWTPFFRPRNAEFKLGFQVLLGLGFLGFTALRSHHYT